MPVSDLVCLETFELGEIGWVPYLAYLQSLEHNFASAGKLYSDMWLWSRVYIERGRS